MRPTTASLGARALLLCCAALGAPAPAAAGWASLGAMPAPERQPGALVFRNAQGIVSVAVLAPDIVRVRFSPAPSFGRDHSYAVASRDLGDRAATIDVGSDRSTISTSALKVTIRHDPFRVAFADAAGESLDEDDVERGIGFTGAQVKVWKRLRDDEHLVGLGEKNGRIDKRGLQHGGSSFTMWTTDAYDYGDDTDPLYASIPFLM